MDKIIEIKNLVRDYTSSGFLRKKKESIRAVNDLSLDIYRGEVFGLLGPNGAGKTTTIKILTTLLAPTSGEVRVLGYRPFGEEKKIRPYINFIYGGERNLYWRVSARDNLSYFSDLYKIDHRQKKKRIEELLDMVGLTDRADEKVENYSKGMKQRLQIARGLVNDPEILFLDEPSIGLDPLGAKDLRDIIKKLSKNGKTIVLTTHYMYEADELCNRIAIVNKGSVVALDSPDNLKKVNIDLSVIEISIVNNVRLDFSSFIDHAHIHYIKQDYSENLLILRIQTNNPSIALNDLMPFLKGTIIVNIETKKASLEDVYVNYVRE
ncbi:ABC transporter ATP-binding protein [Paenibacillus wynnii]|uniref:Daunorubicin ABC transporter ATPase n=1 Tax=Paenibacillus wynnii TaxID=268407 RepID=A0A098M2H4_9BACL|nr:ABC transporter ATP-binding protein [Paenibacillus wynnii]KGE16515.1 daunorubicin ABC transporter ATPase [Paenibacillus wynnii]